MYCNKCGREIPENSAFCPGCGEKLSLTMENSDQNEINKEHIPTRDLSKPYKKERKKLSKKRKIIILIVIILLFIIGIINSLKCEHEWSEVDCLETPVCKLCGKSYSKPLEHDFAEATCNEPKKCKRCKVTEGEALGHDWEEATCTTPKKCRRCDEEDGKKLGHSSDNWKIIKEATCTETGEKTGLCSRCGEEVVEKIKKKSHTTGEWIIKKEAAANSDGIKIKKCSVCKQEVESKKYSLSKGEYKLLCKSYSYKELARNPEQYKGKSVKFTGEVVQVSEASSDLYYSVYRINVTKGNYGYYDDTVYVTFDNSSVNSRILEDDKVTFYGSFQGLKTYTTVMGAELTIPWVQAEYIDVIG